MATEEASSSFLWSREQDKAFENALTIYTEDSSDRWEKIAKDVGGKTVEEIKRHFEILVEDIEAIESGAVPLPCYVSSSDGSGDGGDEGAGSKKGGNSGSSNGQSRHGKKSSRAEQERRKGIAWTEDEHKLFLQGLEKYGKGDWRSISRNFVVTRTPTQVASHAQKYFIRLNSINKDRRRSSIHDITSIDNGDLPSPQGPITGQTNVPVIPVKLNKQPIPHPAGHGGISVYGTPTIGQPIGGPLVSAVGTPVNISQPPHLAYPVRAPVPGTMVPGAPMAYPMQHASSHR